MKWSLLLLIHSIFTFAAGIVLIIAPELIPSAVDINIEKSAYLICYLLGSSELCLAFLSFYTRTLTDYKSIRVITLTFIVFHVATAAVELYAMQQGSSAKLWANVTLRIIITSLFIYYGLTNPVKKNFN